MGEAAEALEPWWLRCSDDGKVTKNGRNGSPRACGARYVLRHAREPARAAGGDLGEFDNNGGGGGSMWGEIDQTGGGMHLYRWENT